MQFHHVCLIVSDLQRSIEMWMQLFDFKVDVETIAPDEAVAEAPNSSFRRLMEDIWGQPETRTKLALLSSPGGALLELQESINPPVQKLPREHHSYYFTGMRELAFRVPDIDAWFEKIQNAGYRMQTPYVWAYSDTARSFAFHDDDNHVIQLWESPDAGW